MIFFKLGAASEDGLGGGIVTEVNKDTNGVLVVTLLLRKRGGKVNEEGVEVALKDVVRVSNVKPQATVKCIEPIPEEQYAGLIRDHFA